MDDDDVLLATSDDDEAAAAAAAAADAAVAEDAGLRAGPLLGLLQPQGVTAAVEGTAVAMEVEAEGAVGGGGGPVMANGLGVEPAAAVAFGGDTPVWEPVWTTPGTGKEEQ